MTKREKQQILQNFILDKSYKDISMNAYLVTCQVIATLIETNEDQVVVNFNEEGVKHFSLETTMCRDFDLETWYTHEEAEGIIREMTCLNHFQITKDEDSTDPKYLIYIEEK